MSHYKQLTCEQRYQINGLMQVQRTHNEIAKIVECTKVQSVGNCVGIVGSEDIAQNRPIHWH